MKKKLTAMVLGAVLVVTGATSAFAATDPASLEDIKTLTKEMFGIHKQIVDKEVESGLITQEQGDALKQSIDQREQLRLEGLDNGQVYGYGMGMNSGLRGGMRNGGQALTEEQLQAWNELRQEHLEAIQNGTLEPGQGIGMGMGMRGGARGFAGTSGYAVTAQY